MWIRIFVCFRPFYWQLWPFNAYLVVFGLFVPKMEENFLNTSSIIKFVMWIILKFYNITIKSANMDKGGGGLK